MSQLARLSAISRVITLASCLAGWFIGAAHAESPAPPCRPPGPTFDVAAFLDKFEGLYRVELPAIPLDDRAILRKYGATVIYTNASVLDTLKGPQRVALKLQVSLDGPWSHDDVRSAYYYGSWGFQGFVATEPQPVAGANSGRRLPYPADHGMPAYGCARQTLQAIFANDELRTKATHALAR